MIIDAYKVNLRLRFIVKLSLYINLAASPPLSPIWTSLSLYTLLLIQYHLEMYIDYGRIIKSIPILRIFHIRKANSESYVSGAIPTKSSLLRITFVHVLFDILIIAFKDWAYSR
jgi:hypothetical protein